jgi:hypothetical protein
LRAATLLLALSALPARAAEPLRPALNWVRLPGAEGCLSAAALAERVELRVGRMLFVTAGEAGLFVDGYVEPAPAGAGFVVALSLSQPDGKVLGRRELRFPDADCAAIDDPVALVIAVTLYPNTGLLEEGVPLDPATSERLADLFGNEPLDPEPASLPPAPAHVQPHPTPRRVPLDVSSGGAPSVAHSEPWRFALVAAASAAAGQLPNIAPGATLQATAVAPGFWPIEAAAQYLPGQVVTSEGAGGRTRFELWLASLALCPFEPAWLPDSALCAGAELGQLHVVARDFPSQNTQVTDVIANVLLHAVYRPAIGGGVHLHTGLAVTIPIVQRQYTFETAARTQADVFVMPQLAGRLELGLAWQL